MLLPTIDRLDGRQGPYFLGTPMEGERGKYHYDENHCGENTLLLGLNMVPSHLPLDYACSFFQWKLSTIGACGREYIPLAQSINTHNDIVLLPCTDILIIA
jgi:hypothetical protein